MDLMMELAVGFSFLNILVLAGLSLLYARIVWKSRAMYPVGLIIFAVLLLAQNLMTVYSYESMTPFFGEAVIPYLFTISILEFGGLLALARVTLQP
jgi:hypothetical protein